MRALSLSLTLLAGFVLAGAAHGQQEESLVEAKFAGDAQTEFGFDLFRQVLSEKSDKEKMDENILTSPTSAAIALSMTMAGANDSTLMQMLKS
jgi:serine protease inhibitor